MAHSAVEEGRQVGSYRQYRAVQVNRQRDLNCTILVAILGTMPVWRHFLPPDHLKHA
jgi:hypothetical protein